MSRGISIPKCPLREIVTQDIHILKIFFATLIISSGTEQNNQSPARSIGHTEIGECVKCSYPDSFETKHARRSAYLYVLLNSVQAWETDGKTLMGHTHTIMKQY